MTTAFFHDGETVRCVDEWRRLKDYARAGSSVWTIARNYAKRHGIAVAWRADDAAIVFERGDGGRVTRRTYPPASVRWQWEGKQS